MPLDLNNLKQMRQAITPGKWKLFLFSIRGIDKAAVYSGNYLQIKPNTRGVDEMVAAGCFMNNATFIASAPSILDLAIELLEQREEAREKIEALRSGTVLDDLIPEFAKVWKEFYGIWQEAQKRNNDF